MYSSRTIINQEYSQKAVKRPEVIELDKSDD